MLSLVKVVLSRLFLWVLIFLIMWTIHSSSYLAISQPITLLRSTMTYLKHRSCTLDSCQSSLSSLKPTFYIFPSRGGLIKYFSIINLLATTWNCLGTTCLHFPKWFYRSYQPFECQKLVQLCLASNTRGPLQMCLVRCDCQILGQYSHWTGCCKNQAKYHQCGPHL